jgi:hypothetical protein
MHMKFSRFKIWSAASAVALLSACGGGGGSSAPVTSTDTFQLRTAYVSYINGSGSWPFSISGTVSGVNVAGSGTETAGSVSSTSFEGQAAQAKTSTATGSFTVNGQNFPLAATSTAYVSSNYDPLGFNGTKYEVVSSSVPIPATARVNDTGTWYSSVRYTSSSKTTRAGTATATFVLEPDTSSTALLKIIRIEKDTANTVTSTSTITFRMTPAGALTRISEIDLQGTTTLTLTY